MLGTKDIKKECCKNPKNRTINAKTLTYAEVICKKCGYIISSHETITK